MAKVLIVDDDEELRMLWEAYLKQMGHESVEAVDGLEALYQARFYGPDLIILDLMMPTASGDFVLGFIRSTDELKNIPVLIISAHNEIASLAAQYEADGYLQKPCNFDDFRAAVSKMLAG